MKIKFSRPYRGWASFEKPYEANEVAELPQANCLYLQKMGWAKIQGKVTVKASNEAIDQAILHNIDLEKVKGTGANGNILVKDVRALIEETE